MKRKHIFLCWILLCLSTNLYASSPIFLRITKNLREKADISVLLSLPKDSYWEKFMTSISRDFDYSGYFSVNESRFVDNLQESKKKYAMQMVLLGNKTTEGINIVVEDSLDDKVLFEKEYKTTDSAIYLAHKICDDIVLHLTGKPGIACSKILFVAGSSGKHQLYQIDYDGENAVKLTNTEYLVHYPKWLIPYQEFLFVSYQGGWPKIVRRNIASGVEKVILSEPGLNACVSPCQKTKEMAVVLSKTGYPEIYISDFNGKIIKRVTYSSATDASPSFSPCGTMIAFVSDRHGSAQVYTMTREGTRVKRISYLSGYATSPAWSPDGNYIAYVFRKEGNFGIAVYEVSNGETKIVGESLGSEDVSWAPNNRHIIYSDVRKSPSTLMVLDIITGEKRKLTDNRYNAFSPCWGVN